MMGVHRIGGQRNLNFRENIPLKSYTQAENEVLYGDDGSIINDEVSRTKNFSLGKRGAIHNYPFE